MNIFVESPPLLFSHKVAFNTSNKPLKDSSMCPGVASASKNEYQDIPGGKDGWCVRVMTLPPSCAECLEILEP